MGAVESVDEAEVRQQSAKSIREMSDVLRGQGACLASASMIIFIMQASSKFINQ